MYQSEKTVGKIVTRNWRFAASFCALFAALAFFFSTVIPPKYESQAQILIIQKNMDVDAYRAAKSSEFAGEVLKRVIHSSDFMNATLAKIQTDSRKYGPTPEDQMENWSKNIRISNLVNTGIIEISVLDQNKRENRRIMEAVVAEILGNNGLDYHGNENITLKKISGPVFFENPSFPITWLNTLLGGVFGMFFSVGLMLLFPNFFERNFARKKEYYTAGDFSYNQ